MKLYMGIIFATFCLSAHGELDASSNEMPANHSGKIFQEDCAAIELVSFFNKASKAFNEYHRKNSYYPKEWWELDFHFTMLPVKWSEVYKYYPTKEMANKWQPDICAYTYIIVEASEDSYVIVTENLYGLDNYRFTNRDRANYAYGKFWITGSDE